MKIIRNNIIPFAGYKAMNLFGVLFVRGNARIDGITLNHEKIHSEQWKELFYIGFLLWYLVEWFVRFLFYSIKWIVEPKSNFDWKHAYRNISFEREAYTNQSDESYIARRKRYSYIKYIK